MDLFLLLPERQPSRTVLIKILSVCTGANRVYVVGRDRQVQGERRRRPKDERLQENFPQGDPHTYMGFGLASESLRANRIL